MRLNRHTERAIQLEYAPPAAEALLRSAGTRYCRRRGEQLHAVMLSENWFDGVLEGLTDSGARGVVTQPAHSRYYIGEGDWRVSYAKHVQLAGEDQNDVGAWCSLTRPAARAVLAALSGDESPHRAAALLRRRHSQHWASRYVAHSSGRVHPRVPLQDAKLLLMDTLGPLYDECLARQVGASEMALELNSGVDVLELARLLQQGDWAGKLVSHTGTERREYILGRDKILSVTRAYSFVTHWVNGDDTVPTVLVRGEHGPALLAALRGQHHHRQTLALTALLDQIA